MLHESRYVEVSASCRVGVGEPDFVEISRSDASVSPELVQSAFTLHNSICIWNRCWRLRVGLGELRWVPFCWEGWFMTDRRSPCCAAVEQLQWCCVMGPALLRAR